jgi:hypothetical protein
MKHSRFGLVVLLSCGGLLACNGDPTASIRDDNPPEIISDPSVLFLTQGESKTITVQLVDAQGNQLPADFEATPGGSQVTVTQDTTFLQTTNGTNLNTKERFVVTSGDAGQTTITVSGGGATKDIPVSVIPTGVAAQFSNAAPAVNEGVTITLPASYKFGPNTSVTTDLADAFISSFSADSTAITVVLPPGSSGPLTLNGVNASFLPGLDLSLPTADPVTADGTPTGGATPAAGPAIPVPALDASTTFYDGGTGGFTGADITGDGGVGAQYYQFVVTEAGHYAFTTNWGNTADIDAVICADAACNAGAAIGATAAQPETGAQDLTPGTYYIAIVLFAGTAPPFIRLDIEHTATPAP